MIYRIAFAIFAAIAIAGSAAEETAADPCRAEDYAEANCTQLCHKAVVQFLACEAAHALLTYSTRCCTSTDGTCCAQGGYKLEGHG